MVCAWMQRSGKDPFVMSQNELIPGTFGKVATIFREMETVL